MRDDARNAGIWCRLEDVSVDAAQALPRLVSRIDGNRAVPEHQRAGIVQPETMIGMGMREEYGIELFQADAQGLLAKIGRCIDEQMAAIIFDEHRGAQPLVAR